MTDAAESCGILASANQTKERHHPEDYNKNHVTVLKQHAYYYYYYYYYYHHHQQQQQQHLSVPIVLKLII